MIIPVILCGGSGTRLWPLSRKMYPKQLLALTGEDTLLQQTAHRLQGIAGVRAPLVICNEEHRFLVAEQLREAAIPPETIILEPIGRNTAPAVALAALYAKRHLPEGALLLILPADHMIADIEAFTQGLTSATHHASTGALVTFGIVPQGPETGYGYIRRGEPLATNHDTIPAFNIAEFVEKPDLATAQTYVDSGEYQWNSGMFLFQADSYLEELNSHHPAMANACSQAYEQAYEDLDFLRIKKEDFAACPSDSIDYAVMEKTDRGVVVPINPGWNDIGSWTALWEIAAHDTQGNVLRGDVLAHDTVNSFIHAESRMVATVGLKDHIVVETADAVLVATKDRVQDVKAIVTRLQRENRGEADLHRKVYRPWGSYESITMSDRFQVKLITVNPGSILSLQMHHHRAEHWIVVRGTARVTKGDTVLIVGENESTFIPLGVNHRLENPGVIPLELIEIQSGSYLGEDDIVRFEDNYGRVNKN